MLYTDRWKYTADLQENTHAEVWFRNLNIILVDKKYDIIILSYNNIVFFVNKNNVRLLVILLVIKYQLRESLTIQKQPKSSIQILSKIQKKKK